MQAAPERMLVRLISNRRVSIDGMGIGLTPNEFVAALVFLLAQGCQSAQRSDLAEATPTQPNATAPSAPAPTCDCSSSLRPAQPANESTPYRPFSSAWAEANDAPRGSLGFEVRWAARSDTFGDARHRWQQVLSRYARTDGEYEDGFHVRHVHAARLELARVHYLLGETKQGDAQLATASDQH
jgi:hypothetical protein